MVKSKYLYGGIIIITALCSGVYIGFFKDAQKSDALVVGTCSGFPPYEYLDDHGIIVGFDIDVARALATAMGKKLDVQDMSFDSLIVALQQGKIDCAIASISITANRQKAIALVHYVGKPLTSLPLVFWKKIPEGVHTIEDLATLENKTVCAQAGSLQQEVISSYQGIEVKHLENIPDLIMDIKYGKSIAAVLEPKVVAALQVEYPELKTIPIFLEQEKQGFGCGIGINKNNKKLIDQISSIVETLKENGTLQQLENKWFNGGDGHGTQ